MESGGVPLPLTPMTPMEGGSASYRGVYPTVRESVSLSSRTPCTRSGAARAFAYVRRVGRFRLGARSASAATGRKLAAWSKLCTSSAAACARQSEGRQRGLV